MSNFNTRKKCENIYQMLTKKEVHIFNVWTIIMQSLNLKEWKLFELQITQTWHPQGISDGKNVWVHHPKKWENIYQM